ncbi:MAG: CaiB/BaiF CoA-transferase family protein [Acuticoccus sp.]
MAGPLEGIRVLDLTRVMSGPFATAMLADIGAEIIKVEMPGFGEEARHFGPYVEGVSAYFCLLNRGKKSIAVDLKAPEGVALIRRIAESADVVVENFRPGVTARLGLDAATLRAANPRLVYASITGFGAEGPLRDRPAFDLVIQAMSGLMSLTGERDGRPLPVGESLADVATGMFASWGILAALYERERTGEGRHVEVAMQDAVLSMLLTGLSRELYTGRPAGRVGARHPETYPVDSFAARDGHFVLVGFTQRIVEGIFAAIGRPELSGDPRFATNDARNANEAVLYGIIAEWAAGRTRDEAIAALAAAGVPCGPVRTLGEVAADPASTHTFARGAHAQLGDIPLVGQPVRFGADGRPEGARAPTLGEDTDAVLAGLGLDAAAIDELKRKKVVA